MTAREAMLNKSMCQERVQHCGIGGRYAVITRGRGGGGGGGFYAKMSFFRVLQVE
jgi:hypothetical protein